MISQADHASWTDGGDTFTISDISKFEKESLPKYFNHSNFSSFVRQLNFYGFSKNILDTDLHTSEQASTCAAKFSHEFFKRGMPELLPKIQRSTKRPKAAKSVEGEDYEALQKQVWEMKNQMQEMQKQMDYKLENAVRILQADYLKRISGLEVSYKNLLQSTFDLLQRNQILPLHEGLGNHAA